MHEYYYETHHFFNKMQIFFIPNAIQTHTKYLITSHPKWINKSLNSHRLNCLRTCAQCKKWANRELYWITRVQWSTKRMTWWPIKFGWWRIVSFCKLLRLKLECFYLSIVFPINFLNQIRVVQSFFHGLCFAWPWNLVFPLGIWVFYVPNGVRTFLRGRNW